MAAMWSRLPLEYQSLQRGHSPLFGPSIHANAAPSPTSGMPAINHSSSFTLRETKHTEQHHRPQAALITPFPTSLADFP